MMKAIAIIVGMLIGSFIVSFVFYICRGRELVGGFT